MFYYFQCISLSPWLGLADSLIFLMLYMTVFSCFPSQILGCIEIQVICVCWFSSLKPYWICHWYNYGNGSINMHVFLNWSSCPHWICTTCLSVTLVQSDLKFSSQALVLGRKAHLLMVILRSWCGCLLGFQSSLLGPLCSCFKEFFTYFYLTSIFIWEILI